MKRTITVIALTAALFCANQASAGWYYNWSYSYVPQIQSSTSYVPVTKYWLW